MTTKHELDRLQARTDRLATRTPATDPAALSALGEAWADLRAEAERLEAEDVAARESRAVRWPFLIRATALAFADAAETGRDPLLALEAAVPGADAAWAEFRRRTGRAPGEWPRPLDGMAHAR